MDEYAVTYLGLANLLVHEVNPDAVTIAEDVSGMAGLAAPYAAGGLGFDFRMAMGVADHWIKWIKEKRDEDWSMGEMWYELTNKRSDEKTVSYAESHDQALVGDKTIIFRLMDKEMYTSMNRESVSAVVDRGIALHKMIRLVTLATSGGGYLNFMGNEFGHPEWIDFPREGNGWSYRYARRQWSLSDADYLRYGCLRAFDEVMIHYFRKEKVLEAAPVLLRADEEKKVLIFSRGCSIFAFNFNPVESFAGYAFPAPAGEYAMAFDSDEDGFNGFSRLRRGESHQTLPDRFPEDGVPCRDALELYLPSRCALVLEKV